jgi:VCBS repeat-containing protein
MIEWPGAAVAAFKKRAESGLVVLRHTGCTVEVLSGCYAEGAYVYTSKDNRKATAKLDGADALHKSVPIGAADLVARGGAMTVDMVVAGHFDASTKEVPAEELRGSCEHATHLVTGWSSGVFSVRAPKGGVFHSVGDVASCVEQKDAIGPPPGCGAHLNVELFALPGAEKEAEQAAAAAKAAAEAAAAPAEPPAPEPVVEDKPKRKTREPVKREKWRARRVHIGAWAGAGGGLVLTAGAFVVGALSAEAVKDGGSARNKILNAANDSINDANTDNDVDPDMSGDLCQAGREAGDETGGVVNAGVVRACDDSDRLVTLSTAMWVTGGILAAGTAVAGVFIWLTGTKPKKATAKNSLRVLAGPTGGGAMVGVGGRF